LPCWRVPQALTAISEGEKDGPGEASPEGAEALRELFGDVLQHPEPLQHVRELLRQPEQLRHVGELIEGSDVRYPMPAGSSQPHPLLGKLAPDLQLETRHGRTRVAELMHAVVIAARCLTKPAPAAALLIRPDCRVA